MTKEAKKDKPKQGDLPTMEDRKIPELHAAAEEYADGRDDRMAMTKKEVDLKTRLIDLMHRFKKTTYSFNGLTIELIPEKEKVRVRIAKDVD